MTDQRCYKKWDEALNIFGEHYLLCGACGEVVSMLLNFELKVSTEDGKAKAIRMCCKDGRPLFEELLKELGA